MCTYHFLKKKKGMELWQWHCRIPFHFSQFQKFFLPPYFGNIIATIAKNLYPLFRQCHCRKLIFFSSHFRQWHCHNCQKKFSPIIWFSLHALTLRAPTRAAGMGRKNCGNTIAENQKFLSPTFYLSLSNFCWISAIVLPQFTIFPQITE